MWLRNLLLSLIAFHLCSWKFFYQTHVDKELSSLRQHYDHLDWNALQARFSNASKADFSRTSRRLTKAVQYDKVARTAAAHGFGNCGSDNNTASLKATAAAFSKQATFLSETTGQKSEIYFRDVTLMFPAMDQYGKPRKKGGDEFVFTFLAWVRHDNITFAFKTAVPAEDMLNGTYSVDFKVPAIGLDAFNLTLMQYYACNQGFGLHKGREFYPLDFGPTPIEASERLSSFLRTDKVSATSIFKPIRRLPLLPTCEISQEGVDRWMDGAWIERGAVYPNEITLRAQWRSFHCRLRRRTNVANSRHRIGDSTMPKPTLQVGDPYHHYQEYPRWIFQHHDLWMDYLWQQLPNHTSNDVLLFSGGLHQLARKYNAPTATDLVLRMVCQIGLRFPGKILIIGPPPVQQQLYYKSDNTDQNVMWVSALLRMRIHAAQGHLDALCDKADLASFWSLADKQGNAHLTHEARKLFRMLGHNVTDAETRLVDYMNGISLANISAIYGGRGVLFADIHDVLLPRPECYKDKLHDVLIIDQTALAWTEHNKLLDDLSWLRGKAAI